MKIGFLSDAHGNLPGLLACLDSLRQEGAEQIYFLGDAIGYLPAGLAVIEELKHLNIPCLLGNHEAMVKGLLPLPDEKNRIYRLSLLMKGLVPDWPRSRIITVGRQKILLVHGRPADPLSGYCYQAQSLTETETVGYSVVVMGHTHHPYVDRAGTALVINDGSCGFPRDGQQQLSCSYYDTSSETAKILFIPFDFKKLLGSFTPGTVAGEVMTKLLKG
ncbi:MAG: YfcE family phosphodiesterase [bacterium]|nr:YfcE family phosphodiesterase [bacterium]